MVIYICSPLRATEHRSMAEHQADARRYMSEVLDLGPAPIVPHLLYTQVLDDDSATDREVGLRAGLELVKAADEIWVFGPYLSGGMWGEIRTARIRDIPVRWFPAGHVANGYEITVDWLHLRGPDGKIVEADEAAAPARKPAGRAA